MARRKRLDPTELAANRPAPEAKSMGMPDAAAPPIARVAGESAGGGARALAMADEAGRLLHAIPLSSINIAHLTRDRISATDDGMQALRASILEHGQRMPVEVMQSDAQPPYHFGLISGYRRMQAVVELAAQHPEDTRFTTIKAFIRQPDDLRGAYVAMVEENEIREDVSHFERARVALMAAQAEVFESVEEAVNALYAAGSKARRSKIRSFVLVVQELGNALTYPQSVNERLGLRLAEAIRAGQGARLAQVLSEGSFEDAAGQNAVLDAALNAKVSHAKPSRNTGKVSYAKPLFEHRLPNGATVALHRTGGISRLEFAGHELTPHQAQMLAGALEVILESDSPK
ncbi:chromosome partitioning protein, ParB family [Monaibacterium marinum]|uniref:Chromosome partitioning protein, ParB family n=1 Tax=Pontivivens marinum TaxID=1690039 RepID=A0A2C9CVB4_9RHOB|nr:ParB N-terminal domain-containing protein [Monaibacterium marinum]SOH95431.1 chromosome partitioning protein, ParB family [Monaibacterium marinum]